MTALSPKLSVLFDHERELRKLQAEIAETPTGELVTALRAASNEARTLEDHAEGGMRLARIADLLAEQLGPEPVDLLLDVLGSEIPEARLAAGEALESIAFERFKEVALGIERALERFQPGNPALAELPYLLAEVAEPGCVKLLARFLKHEDPEAVAAAIDAVVAIGDPSAAHMLTALEKDSRQVHLDDEEGDEGMVTIGELATEARTLFAELEPPGRAKKR